MALYVNFIIFFDLIAATADVMDQENSVEHVANNSLRRRRNLHGDFQYCNGPSEYYKKTDMTASACIKLMFNFLIVSSGRNP